MSFDESDIPAFLRKENAGLFHKFNIERTDGKSAPGQKHDGCDYFVLDLTHDPFAIPALTAYAGACEAKYPRLFYDLKRKAAIYAFKHSSLDKIPSDLFSADRLPERDKDGWVTHPDVDLIMRLLGGDDEGEATYECITRIIGYSISIVTLDDDNQELSEAYAESGDGNCSAWEPKTPDGSLFIWICDTDDGPVAAYARKKP
jgi:hypothetical protein